MEYFMALDGGGTKLQGIIFDEDYRMIASALSGGINGNVYSMQVAQEHVRQCVSEMLEQAAGKNISISRIKRVVSSWGGTFQETINRICPVEQYEVCGEGTAGILCCGHTDGLLALSGTGSDVFLLRNIRNIDAIGGWGYVIGDDGSGTWIGRQAIRSMLRVLEGIEPEISLVHQTIRDICQCRKPDDLVHYILSSPSPGHCLGRFCKVVNEAAMKGDALAEGILREAGQILGESTIMMKQKHCLPDDENVCTVGSVFVYCTAMRDGFESYLQQHWPGCSIHHALFQPIIGCVIYAMLQNGHQLDRKTVGFLKEEYRAFCT